MLMHEKIADFREKAVKMLNNSGIVLTEIEKNRIEICDYNLGMPNEIGTQILTYVNTSRCCAKELILFPHQICPEHIHPAIGAYPGKEETFRCRWGEVYLYVPGTPVQKPLAKVPENSKKYFTVWHEIFLHPGEQYTLREQTLHWFQAGTGGAVISEFSTQSFDNEDIFTDPSIKRIGSF
ncbi:MAG: hypothetical protein PHV82_03040 [Victivallaceae bacterium]|nr:hypothetical protein [Victivallaceae bacterium]